MGTAAHSMRGSGGGIAWWAHIGGFLAGAAMIVTILRPKKSN
jgi:membrane associated rhomboid family serine protease